MATDPILRITHRWSGTAGLPGISTTYAQGELGDADTIVDAWIDFWDALSDLIANNFTVTMGGAVDRIDPVTGNIIEVGSATVRSVVGSSVGQFLPLASQGVLEFLTGVFVGGRQVRGKMFVPGIVEDQNEEGVPTSGCITAFEDALNDVNGIDGMNGAWVVWSRANAQTQFVTSSFMWSKWGVLRSRRD